MERVAFLIEKTGERVPCLLNPASITMRRSAGVRVRGSDSGPLTGAGLTDDPLLYTGGGTTELLLDLLFDVSLVTAPEPVENVLNLTRPLTGLSEGSAAAQGAAQLPVVRLIWGTEWNVPGVVTAVAERLEQFTPGGAPQRSWLRMRFVRVAEPASTELPKPTAVQTIDDLPDATQLSPAGAIFHDVQGTGDDQEGGGHSERLDEMAAALYGDPGWWRVIAQFNDIDDPWSIEPGRTLMLPSNADSPGGAA